MSATQFSMAMAALMERDSVTTLCRIGELFLSQHEQRGYIGPQSRRVVVCECARAVNCLEEHEREQLERWLSEPPSFDHGSQGISV